MAQQGFGGASLNFHIDKRFTTLELIGTRDCDPDFPQKNPDLLVWGGTHIHKTLCVDGDAIFGGDMIIEGNLTVLGEKIIEQVDIVVVEDKNICLGNVVGMPATNITANGGGIIIKGPQPDGSKSWLWYNDIGPAGAWRSNQDIDIGSGRLQEDGMGECGCGSDEGGTGFAYRINANLVLDATTLGPSVINSSLQTVGVLRQGSINNANPIVSIVPGVMTCVNTMYPHFLMTGDDVSLTGTNSVPTIDGCRTVMVTSPTQFKIVLTTSFGGNTGLVHGSSFPIDIGTSTIDSGTHTIICGESLIVENSSGLTRFVMNGATEQLDLINTLSQSYTQHINTNISGMFNGVQRSLFIENISGSNTTTSVSVAADMTQCYNGTNTVFPNIENTVQSLGERIVMKTNTQFPLPKISARAIDVTSNSLNNRGSNVGVYAEGGGPSGSDHSAGVIGFTNSNSGTLSTGVMGCANRTRADIATEIGALGSNTIGVYACNPLNGPNDWGLYVNGKTNLNGDVIINGNTSQTGDVNVTGTVTATTGEFTSLCVDLLCGIGNNPITLTNDLIPASGNCINLGSALYPFCEVYAGTFVTGNLVIDNLTVNTVTANVISTNFFQTTTFSANTIVTSIITTDLLFGNIACITDLLVETMTAKLNGTIDVQGNLIPMITNTFTLGDATHEWLAGWFNSLHISGNVDVGGKLTINELCTTGNSVFNGDVTFNGNVNLDSKVIVNSLCVQGDTHLLGNLLVDGKTTLIQELTTNDVLTQGNLIVVGMTLLGNTIIDGKLIVNDLCVLNDQTIDGNLTVLGKTNLDDVMINNLAVMGNVTVEQQLITGNLTVLGKTTLDELTIDNLAVMGNVTVGNDLITENQIVNGNLIVVGMTLLGNTIIDGKLTVNDLCVLQDQTIDGNLTVLGKTNLDNVMINNLAVMGNVTVEQQLITGNLTVLGKTTLDELMIDNLSVIGNVTIGNELITENALINGNLTVLGTITLSNTHITGKLTVDDLCVLCDQTIDGNLTVLGKTNLDNVMISNLAVMGNVTIANELITENQIVNGNLIVVGMTLLGNTTVDGKLTVNDLCVLRDQTIDGNLTVLGKTNLDNVMISNLAVMGNVTIANELITENQIVNGNLTVIGKTALNEVMIDNLAVMGNVTIGNELITESALINGNLTVLGKTNLDNVMISNLAVMGNVTIANELITENQIVNGNLTVLGKTTLNEVMIDNLAVMGNVNTENTLINGNLVVVGMSVLGNTDIDGKLMVNQLCVLDSTVLYGNVTFLGTTQIGCETLLPPVMLQTTNASLTSALFIPTLLNTSYLLSVNGIGMRSDRAASAIFKLNAAYCNNTGVLRKLDGDDVLKFDDPSASIYDLNTSLSGANIVINVKGAAATTVNWNVCASYVILSA